MFYFDNFWQAHVSMNLQQNSSSNKAAAAAVTAKFILLTVKKGQVKHTVRQGQVIPMILVSTVCEWQYIQPVDSVSDSSHALSTVLVRLFDSLTHSDAITGLSHADCLCAATPGRYVS